MGGASGCVCAGVGGLTDRTLRQRHLWCYVCRCPSGCLQTCAGRESKVGLQMSRSRLIISSWDVTPCYNRLFQSVKTLNVCTHVMLTQWKDSTSSETTGKGSERCWMWFSVSVWFGDMGDWWAHQPIQSHSFLKRPLLPLDTRIVTKPTHVPHYHITDMLFYNSAGLIWEALFILSWVMWFSPIGLTNLQ